MENNNNNNVYKYDYLKEWRNKNKDRYKMHKQEKRNLSKNANVTKRKTQQSSTGLLYHPTVSFFSFIWSFSPK